MVYIYVYVFKWCICYFNIFIVLNYCCIYGFKYISKMNVILNVVLVNFGYVYCFIFNGIGCKEVRC